MTGKLSHRPSQMIQQLLINNGFGTDPSTNSSWPVFYAREPDRNDNQITVLDRAGITGPRLGLPSIRHVHRGLQILIRGLPEQTAYDKNEQVTEYLDQTLYDEILTIDSSSYRIYTVTRVGDTQPLGVEPELSKRFIFSTNLLVALQPL